MKTWLVLCDSLAWNVLVRHHDLCYSGTFKVPPSSVSASLSPPSGFPRQYIQRAAHIPKKMPADRSSEGTESNEVLTFFSNQRRLKTHRS